MSIKHVTKHLLGLLHAMDTYYTCFFDLDANLVELTDGTLEYPMVSIRKKSGDQHHPLLRENYRRGLAYSQYQEARFKKLLGQDASIHDKSSIWWRLIAAPVQEYWNRQDHDKHEEAKPTESKYPEEPH